MMKVNLLPKEPKSFLNYKYSSPIYVNKENIQIDHVNFHIPTLIEEVKLAPKKEMKKYKKVIVSFLATATGFMGLASTSMANTIQPSTSIPSLTVPATSLPSEATGVPPELMQLMIMGLAIIIAIGVIACTIMLVAAGLLRAVKKRKEAIEWTSDIIKGLIQILLAPSIVFLLYYVATKLLSGSSWFISPFSLN